MKTIEEILAVRYTGDPDKDFLTFMAIHYFIMDDRNSYPDRAAALRDMTVRGMGEPSMLVDDVTLVDTYVQSFADVFSPNLNH